MRGRLQIVVALMIACALAWVLISPALDELPGTTSRQVSLLLTGGLVFGIAAVQLARQAVLPLEVNSSHRIDVLSSICTRLC